ncbi:Small nuclear ribonucleoprotein Sm D3 [Heracleum sosnowskyi]|uniref:Small nuclear ribonucleoprotein Sm D3 n=1 Tax=Heracleum sosnowskyi TaxID=360622 RepID=A0AAD8H9H0_9APIA|nr:Small nuclear ribonucleoprotein Sm D3 [Heracleum sosnowskyi]
MSVGIPVKLLHEAVEHVVTVELKTGELYRGTMIDSQHNWNCVLENVTFTATGGQVSKLEHIFIRGSKIRLMVLPDMFKYSPVFKILKAKIKGKGSSIGVSRGRAVGMQAKGEADGSGARPGRGRAHRQWR